MTAPMMPERAYGSTVVMTASQRVAPRASAASRWRVGHGQQHLARHRHDVRHDHDREDDPGGEHRRTVDRALEEAAGTRVASRRNGKTLFRSSGMSTKMPQSP